ncbi:MAG: hypothetical protein IJG37_06715 [Synergistaceae bacterium]|nr:hypothetical protein [Synergistaceae bacterium]
MRVFPHRTRATPEDEYATTEPPGMFPPENISEVHVSVAFTYDKERAEMLAEAWSKVAPEKIGGPAFNEPGGEFMPGMYLKPGYVITSRGCPNHCWFCAVPKRERNGLHELTIKEGWNVLDDNLLACSESHIRAVFDMLGRQKHKARFTGGFEAKLLWTWHIELLRKIHAERVYFAYDTPDDYEPLHVASRMLREARYLSLRRFGVYCLCGYPSDTMEKAVQRFEAVIKLGMCPYAMLWRDKDGEYSPDWKRFQREWVSPQIVYTKYKRELSREYIYGGGAC